MLLEFIKTAYQKLCVEIGERHLGSVGEIKAQEYLLNQFKSMGYTVSRDPYTSPGWEHSASSLSCDGVDFAGHACFFSNSCDLKAPLTIINNTNQGMIDKMDLKDTLVFWDCGPTYGDAVYGRNEFAEKLDSLGVAGIITISEFSDTYNTKIIRSPHLKRAAVFSVSGDTAVEIYKKKESLFHLKVDAHKKEYESANIIAQTAPASKKIIIGAHYDTAPGTQGACDNGSGTITLLEMARLLQNHTFNHQIEFVAFGGEEYGGMAGSKPIGSYMYVDNRKNDLKNIRCMMNIDDVGFVLGTLDVCVQGSKTLSSAVVQGLKKTNQKISTSYPTLSDDIVFSVQGIPTILATLSNNQFVQRHTPKDNIERVSYEQTGHVAKTMVDILLAIDNSYGME